MRIAICDWDIKNLFLLKNAIYRYAEKIRIDVLIECYQYGEKMLESGERYNLVFINYELLGNNGLEIAEKLRKIDAYTAIVFTGRSTDFIIETFKVNPFGFLLLPIRENQLNETLNTFFKKISNSYMLCLKNGDYMQCVNSNEIVYLEAWNKRCFVNLEKEKIVCNRTMARMYEVLPKSQFLKINRAFIINCNYVKKYNSEYVFLKNGESLPISRNYVKEFKVNFQNNIEFMRM